MEDHTVTVLEDEKAIGATGEQYDDVKYPAHGGAGLPCLGPHRIGKGI